MIALLHELRHALRAILARPAFSALVVGVLAAGLACVVFMLAFLDGFVLRPLPFADPDALYQAGTRGDGGLGDVFPMTDQDLVGARRAMAPVADLAGVARSTVNLSDLDRPERYNGAHASANLFRVLGVAPLLGRDFAAADEQPGAPPVVMLSYALWQNRYAGDPAVVGRTIRVDAHPATVIGVMPRDFSYPRREAIWLAATLAPAAAHDEYAYWFVLRRHAGVGAAQLEAAFGAWFADAARADPERLRDRSARVEPLRDMLMDRTTRAMLGMLLVAVSMVLLIACANAANLLFARLLGRRQELAVRVALGASRARVVAHVFAQSLVLSLAAVAVALPLAQFALARQEALLRESEFTLLWLHFGIDARVLALALGAALLTALASGLLPALQAANAAPGASLHDGSARTAGNARFARASRVLVVAEVALSCALVVCVGTLVRGIGRLEHADLGIDTRHLLTARVLLPARYPDAASQTRLYERLGERLRAEPGVVAASVGTALPGTYYNEMRDVVPAGTPPGATVPQTAYAAVDDHFPAAWGVPLIAGRFFDARDGADGERVAVVDLAFAQRYGGAGAAGVVGRRFRLDPRDANGATVTVVGVIGDVALDAPGQPPPPALLVPLRQAPFKIASIAVRTRGPALAFAPVLDAAMHEVDADTPLYWVRDYAHVLRAMSFGERVVARSFTLFGAIALLLAGAGLYGVMAFAVGQRTREIGVRRALGASSWTVLRGLFARNLAQVALGLALGLAAGIPFAHALGSSLRTIEPGGAWVVAAAVLVLGAAALLAVLVPARRALRIDPAIALRHE